MTNLSDNCNKITKVRYLTHFVAFLLPFDVQFWLPCSWNVWCFKIERVSVLLLQFLEIINTSTMAQIWLFIIVFIQIFNNITYGLSATGDLLCEHNKWSVLSAEWEFNECQYENTDAVNGAMSWIGDNDPNSLAWSDYTVEMTMTPTPGHNSGNGGLAFYINDAGACGTCGSYYAISLLLSNPDALSNYIIVYTHSVYK